MDILDYLFARDIKAELDRDAYVKSRMWPNIHSLIDDSTRQRMVVETSLVPNIGNIGMLITSIYFPLFLLGIPLIEYCRVADRKKAFQNIKRINEDRAERLRWEAERYMNELGDILL